MSSIHVRNFGPIREAEIDLNRLTLLIGEQASGKSTLAKLVYFFKSLRGQLQYFEPSQEAQPEELEAFKSYVKRQFVQYFGTADTYGKDFCVQFTYKLDRCIALQGNPLELEILPGDWEQSLFEIVYAQKRRIQKAKDEKDFNGEELARLQMSNDLGTAMHDHEVRYFLAGRSLVNSFSETLISAFREELRMGLDSQSENSRSIEQVILREYILHTERVREKFKDVGILGALERLPEISGILKPRIANLLKGNYQYPSGKGESLTLKGGQEVPLEHASTGQQETIRLVLDTIHYLRMPRPIFRIIEEPEAHLFPVGQRALQEILALLISGEQIEPNGLFITTHSPYILLAIDNLIKAGEMAHAQPQLDALITEQTDIPPQMRLRFGQVGAWWLQDGELTDALSEERQGINLDYVDQVATEMEQTYDDLLSLGYDHADL